MAWGLRFCHFVRRVTSVTACIFHALGEVEALCSYTIVLIDKNRVMKKHKWSILVVLVTGVLLECIAKKVLHYTLLL